MGTYAKKTCHECGIRRTINLMVAKKVRVKSGNIGWGLSLNPSRKKSARITKMKLKFNSFLSNERFAAKFITIMLAIMMSCSLDDAPDHIKK